MGHNCDRTDTSGIASTSSSVGMDLVAILITASLLCHLNITPSLIRNICMLHKHTVSTNGTQ